MSASAVEEMKQLGDASIQQHSKASSGGWHDEKDDYKDTRQNLDAQDLRDSHGLETIEARSLAGSQLLPPPDGGLHAWLKVFGGFLVYINI
jgi:hypothetical protein